jgi:hypothetical protein
MNFPLGLALDVPKPPKIIYVDADAGGANNGLRWDDAYNNLQDALAVVESDSEIHVAQGIYKPTGFIPPPPPPMAGSNSQEPVATAEDRTATFLLINGVAIYGGYAGVGEPKPNERDIELYETILSGDIRMPGDISDNSYHVVTGSGCDETAVLDGFIITAGNANGSNPYDRGGGLYNYHSSPTLYNCTFSGNSAGGDGGGMFNWNSSPTLAYCTFSGNSAHKGGGMHNRQYSDPRITNCTFIANSAGGEGGGMRNKESGPTVTNCTFSGNSSGFNGGGIQNALNSSSLLVNCLFSGNWAERAGGGLSNFNTSSTTVTNCTFSGNSAGEVGGGMHNNRSSNPTVTNCTFSGNLASENGGGMGNRNIGRPTLINCTFSGNRAEIQGGGVFNDSSSISTLANCILWGNTAPIGPQIDNDGTSWAIVSYSDVQGGWPGTGNINANPLFVDSAIGDYHLLTGSPCINAGDPGYIAQPGETDLDGKPRIIGGRIDMGVYEFNHNPIAHAGPDRTVETQHPCRAVVTFDGSGSSDVDSTPVTNDDVNDFNWYKVDPCDPNADVYLGSGMIMECNLSVGEHIIALEVIDRVGAFDVDYVNIIVQDKTPPVFTHIPQDLTTECGGSGIWILLDSWLACAIAVAHCGSVTATNDFLSLSDGCGTTGSATVTWTAEDEYGNAATSPPATFTIADTTPPVITCPADVTLECPVDTSVEANGSAKALDTCGSVTITHSDLWQPSCGNAGMLMRTWMAADECGNSTSCVQTITVVDTTPPEFEFSVTPAILWPPNHKMVEITPSWTVSDECDPSPDVSLVSIIAKEGDATIGDGHTSDDIQIGEDGSIYLRAKRSGTGTGRIYNITYQVVDDCGNVTVRSATVTVPHDLSSDMAPEY